MIAFPRAALLVFLALGVQLGAVGCVYRPNIQQGNLLKVQDIDQVTVGMTRSQVRYVLGTPMLADPFDAQRWDYIYTLQRGRESRPDRAHFIVHFEGDKVSRVERPDLPELPELPRVDPAAEPSTAAAPGDTTREPPAPPSIKQPQPDAVKPGSSDR